MYKTVKHRSALGHLFETFKKTADLRLVQGGEYPVGMSYNDNGKPDTLHIPALTEDCTSLQVNAVYGYLFHELLGHDNHTNFELVKAAELNEQERDLFQLFQGAYVDRKAESDYRGAGAELIGVLEQIAAEDSSKALILAWVRATNGMTAAKTFLFEHDGAAVANDLCANFPADKVAALNSTQDCIDLARALAVNEQGETPALTEELVNILGAIPKPYVDGEYDRISPYMIDPSMQDVFSPDSIRATALTEEFAAGVKAMSEVLRTGFLRAIQSHDHDFYQRGTRSGRLDAGALSRSATGNADSMFKQRRQRRDSASTAVAVMVDMSGSMGYSGRMECAMQVFLATAQQLRSLDVPFELSGFTTARTHHYYGTGYNKYDRVLPLFNPILKGFGAPMTTRIEQQCHTLTAGMEYLGENIDGESLVIVLSRLTQRQETRKIIVFISDGEPAGLQTGRDELFLKQAVDLCAEMGVILLHFCLTEISPYAPFANSTEINPQDPTAAAVALTDTITKAIVQ